MKGRLKKVIAGVLFAVMVAGSTLPEAVYAAEGGYTGEQEEGQILNDGDEGQNDSEEAGQTETDQEQTSEPDSNNDITGSNSQSGTSSSEGTDNSNSVDGSGDVTETDSEDNSKAGVETDSDMPSDTDAVTKNAESMTIGAVDFVYIESPYLETPDTQRIVFAFDDVINGVDSITITVENEHGTQEEWQSVQQKEGVYLFEKYFDGEAYTGTYHVTSLNLYTQGQAEILNLADMGIEAEFGVNEEYDGYEELQPLDEETSDQSEDLEASVVTIDENGVTEAQDSIADALNTVSAETSSVSAFSRSATNSATSRSGNIVVALDPGHDSRSTGASANGLREEVLTLKIANYCKEELEQYAGVEVYMTRTDADCPYDMNGAGCIEYRVRDAAAAGAQIYVSFHLNSSSSSSAKGAEVIIPNPNWRPNLSDEGEELARSILDELVKVGLTERPNSIYWRNSESGSTYSDGSLADYFSVQRNCKLNNIPGIIIEHAFLTNSGDANTFLKSEAGLKSLGVADATGIAKYLGLNKIGDRTSVPEGTYVLESALDSDKVASVANSSASDSAAITLNDNADLSSQRFEVISTGDGYYKIVAEHSGKVLDVKGGSSVSGTPVQQYTENSTSSQQWGFVDAGNGYYYICSALGTFLDVKLGVAANGTQIQTYAYNGTNSQKWKLVASDYQPIESGTYTITSKADASLAVEVADSAISDKANVQLGEKNDLSHQRVEISYAGAGYYKIAFEHSSKVLDVDDGSKKSGANVWQYTWNNTSAQLWKFVEAGNGTYYIKSKLGTVLGISSANVTSGSNICTQTMKDENSLKWQLQKVNEWPVKEGQYFITTIQSDDKILNIRDGNAELGAYAGLESQMFDIEQTDEAGYYTIKSVASGKVLDVYKGSSQSKANLWEYSANGTDSQKWKFIRMDGDSYYIKSKLGTVIDISNGVFNLRTNIWMYVPNQSVAQKWRLYSPSELPKEQPLSNGTYTIRNLSNQNYVMDVSGGLEANKTKIQMYSSNNTSSQHFEFYYVGKGYYRIFAEHSGKALDVDNGSASNGTALQQYTWNQTDSQLWRIMENGEGGYYLQSKLGTVVDISSSNATSGTKVILNEKDNIDDSQSWVLEEVDYQPVEEGLYSIRNTSNIRYTLDIADKSTSENANAWIYSYNGSDAQLFDIEYVDNGYYRINIPFSGKVLQCTSDTYKVGENANQGTWDGSDGQLWKFVTGEKSGVYIRSKTGTVLDIYNGQIQDKTKVQMYTANNTISQKWTLRPEFEAAEIAEGTYIITTALKQNMVLDVYNGSSSNKANVQIYQANGTEAQKFKVEPVSDGYYKITCVASGKVLDVANGLYSSGTNVWQYQWNGTASQLWKFIENDDGTYYIQSQLGTVLDVYNGGTASGTNVQTYNLNRTDSQKWILEEADTLYEIMGATTVTVDQMVSFYESRSTICYPYSNVSEASTIRDFCEIYMEECEIEGVKAEVAFCQAMLETGFLRFGGDVKKEQYNFAGLGATGGGVSGASFDTIREGIRAQVQHLKAYASTESLKQDLVDPRFQYVTRGCAKYVEWLGIHENPSGKGWAASKNYGYNIVNLYINPLKSMG